MSLKLHILNKRYSSWSMRPWVLLKALNIPFEEAIFYVKPGWRQPQLLAFSPTGKVPCLHDGDLVLWDSLAITEYLAEAHPGVWPADRAARAWARCAAAEMHSGFGSIRDECSMNVGLRIELGEMSEGLKRDVARFNTLFTEGLGKFGGPWLAGEEFTAVDAFYAPIASRCRTFGIKLEGEAQEYLERLFKHEAVQAWIQEGIKEEREPMHEDGCILGRKVLEDLSA